MTEHEWQDNPTHDVETSYGVLKVVISGGSSAYDDEAHSMRAYVSTHPYEINADQTQIIKLWGVEYCAVSLRLTQEPTGLWRLAKDEYGYDHRSITGARPDAWGEGLTPAASKELRDKLVPQLETWLLTHPDLVDDAQAVTAQQNAHTVADQLEKADALASGLRRRLERLDAIAQDVYEEAPV